MILSVVIITHNEESNIGRTLASVQPLVADGKGEIIVVDSGSTDHTVDIAKAHGAKVFIEEWKGYAAQKNSAIDKATGDFVLSLDADEAVSSQLASEISLITERPPRVGGKGPGGAPEPVFVNGFSMPRKNHFLGRWVRYGGFWPDRKVRMFRNGAGQFRPARVHETLEVKPDPFVRSRRLRGALIHHCYPTLSDYLDHMNRYSSLGAEMVVARGPVRFSVFNIVVRPLATFLYNYVFRLGFLDGREGLLLHLYHAVYVSWKYAKSWELARQNSPNPGPR